MPNDEQLHPDEVGSAQARAKSAHPHLDEQFFSNPVQRFINPAKYEGLPLKDSPTAADALQQPGVISALRDILEDLTKQPEAPKKEHAND